jgi:hypothetical protein
VSRRPTRTDLAVFGLILPLVFALAGWAAVRHGWSSAGPALWAAGGLLTLAYWLVGPLRWPLYQAWMALFHPVGLAVSQGLMALVYFAVVTPTGLLLRLAGRDPLGRALQRGQPGSYWLPHRPGGDVARYLRQS